MKGTPLLDFIARARAEDPGTSKAAARSITKDRLSVLEVAVLRSIAKLVDATSEEVAAFSGEDLQSVTPRFRPLAERGLLELTGAKRKGRSGRSRQVWQLTALGESVVRNSWRAEE